MPVRVWRVDSMRPNVHPRVTFSGNVGEGHARHWRDLIDVDLGKDSRESIEIRAAFSDGHPAYVKYGAVHYFASLFDDASTQALFARVAREAGLEPEPLGDTVRVSRRGGVTWVFNYGTQTHTLQADLPSDAFLIGSRDIEPQGIAAYRTPAR
jgi:beta-galactosidase